MKGSSVFVIEVLSVVVAAALLGYFLQTNADSGERFYSKIVWTILVTVISHLSVFVLLRLRGRSSHFVRLVLLSAVLGTILNLTLTSIFEGYQGYMDDIANDVVRDPFREGVRIWGLRMLILTPLQALVFVFLVLPVKYAIEGLFHVTGTRQIE